MKILALVCGVFLLLFTSNLHASNITFKSCSSSEKKQVKKAVKWLKSNMGKIDAKMGKNGLKAWPGNSRKKFKKKLGKKLKFVCVNDRRKCKPNKKKGTILLGQVIPIFKQKTIHLCTENFFKVEGTAKAIRARYAATIAHEVAHLVRLNAHRKDCAKYTKPRFSQSVGLATYHGYLKIRYRASDYGC